MLAKMGRIGASDGAAGEGIPRSAQGGQSEGGGPAADPGRRRHRHDRLGITWGRDGDNVKAVLESAIKKQQLGDRYSLDVFTGKQVTPDRIVAHFRDLAVGPHESLVFYYSGHGGLHYTKGHYLALTHGRLYRSDLLAAMASNKPQLTVVLTDCCANWYGGALHGEPAGTKVVADANKTVAYRQAPVQREAPPGETVVSLNSDAATGGPNGVKAAL